MKEFKITSESIGLETIKSIGEDHSIGARSVFEGTVRNANEGHDVTKLEYECYESLAIKEGNRILLEATEMFGLIDAFCIHRIGTLDLGETAVVVVATSGHRNEAFKGCRFIIDEVKSRVPIWKKEHYRDGETEWLKGAG
ncbi:MAG: molybdenum cofactor biosynthesis protein MoaE [Gammaproteobacteria bacterium]|nr:molybdenum cofactor biosynthesis protein MoaE [Gammaproteobacteria bacterium]HJM09132.1 molybdenum cofactor biosynthesis protein MoaE [Gammaproteobacteria bacterium]HJN00210.1 molybdenum cofactor biosynthesis protein MoaE [Gammaproteobacteria bacterium]|tara:strand:+ start:436 stop:855 length:420 start_codon:yes stop_codon:yes gene_type:complete